MIQDIFPKHLDNQYRKDAVIEDGDFIISLLGNEILFSDDFEKELIFPRYTTSTNVDKEKFIYIFSIDEDRYFLLREEKLEAAAGFSYQPMQGIRSKNIRPKDRLYALYTAKHIADWYRDNQFCGRCGKPMHHSDTERCMVCECGNHSYPRIMPAVIVGIRNGDRILLTKYRTGFGYNALVAGFVEIGETIEETVQREVLEETGLKVKNITYYKSQPWGIANDILVGYYCDVDGDDTITMDANELRYAEWVKRSDIELQPDDAALTNEMMRMFKEGKQ